MKLILKNLYKTALIIALEHNNKEIYEFLLSLDNIDYNASCILDFLLTKFTNIVFYIIPIISYFNFVYYLLYLYDIFI